jgi:hypothetical protein
MVISTPRGKSSSRLWTGGCVSPRADLERLGKRKELDPASNLNPSSRPLSLCLLSNNSADANFQISKNRVVMKEPHTKAKFVHKILSPGGVKNFLFSTSSRPALGPTQPPIQWVPGALSPGVKQLWREADHSPPASTKVKKMWSYTTTPLYTFME